jgi:hypothetical protein
MDAPPTRILFELSFTAIVASLVVENKSLYRALPNPDCQPEKALDVSCSRSYIEIYHNKDNLTAVSTAHLFAFI